MAWLRASGPRLLAVDPKTGYVLREVHLAPAPFGLTWHVERHGGIFIVRDDREIAAYEEDGTRLWKRAWPTKIAIGGMTEDGKHVSVIPTAEGIDVALADLRIGEFTTKLSIGDNTMQYVLPNAVVAGDRVVFATDQRNVFTVGLGDFEIREQHHLYGSHVLPPVASSSGVHVAAIEERPSGPITRIATLDASGAIVSTEEIAGAAYALGVGASGLVVDVRRGGQRVERVALRPNAPHVRLVAPRTVDMGLVAEPRRSTRPPPLEILPASSPRARREGDEIIPAPREAPRDRSGSPREGFVALLSLLNASSPVLARLADAFDDGSTALLCLRRLGLTLRDPRVRWTARPGRDPNLVDLGVLSSGEEIATYLYPPASLRTVPVLRVSDTKVEWLADDFDGWLARFLKYAQMEKPDVVATTLEALGYDEGFLAKTGLVAPPRWFFEAHGTSFSLTDGETALVAGDLEGAERMLVSAARRPGQADAVKTVLAAVYERLGWAHQRAAVLETW